MLNGTLSQATWVLYPYGIRLPRLDVSRGVVFFFFLSSTSTSTSSHCSILTDTILFYFLRPIWVVGWQKTTFHGRKAAWSRDKAVTRHLASIMWFTSEVLGCASPRCS